MLHNVHVLTSKFDKGLGNHESNQPNSINAFNEIFEEIKDKQNIESILNKTK